MKGFYCDTLLYKENICNLEREQKVIERGVLAGKKLVVYGPRNFGKTSLVKNVIIPLFQRKHPRNFTLFVDFMEVKSIESIHQRMQTSFEKAFGSAFPLKSLLGAAKRFLSSLRPEIGMDPLTGAPVLSLGVTKERKVVPFPELFAIISKKIVPQMPAFVVLDEFQDIALIPEAQGLLRQGLQELQRIPIILMGSKRHILSRLFAKPTAPLASFGEDIEFKPIAYEAYHEYILERFRSRRLAIELSTAKALQDALFRVPEAINIVCADIYENHVHKTIGLTHVFRSIEHVVEGRRSRFEEWLSNLSEKEEEILTALAKLGPEAHPTSQNFLKQVQTTARTVSLTISHFLDRSVVEKTDEGFRVADPLLVYFLKRFRAR